MNTTLKLMVVYAMFFLTFVNTTTFAQAPDIKLEDKSIPEIVEHFAKKYKVNSKQMLAVMKCESSLRPDIQSGFRYTRDNPKQGTFKGQRERSYGLAMIHLPAHPNVTVEQAKDPVFASEFMAKKFSEGKQKMWTCASVIKGKA